MLTNNSKKLIQIFSKFSKKIQQNDIHQGTVEILNAHLTLDPRKPKLDYGPLRPFNESYHSNEEAWYDSMDRCINGHPGIEDNKTWRQIASDSGLVNSNYGYLVHAKRTGGKSQYDFALESLISSYDGKDSGRQSVIYYAGPEMHLIWNDNINAKHDFTCTFNTQHFIRNNCLYYIITQRSADSIFGVSYDFPHHCKVYMKLYEDLCSKGIPVKIGKIYWNFGSLHLYERHFELINRIVSEYKSGELR